MSTNRNNEDAPSSRTSFRGGALAKLIAILVIILLIVGFIAVVKSGNLEWLEHFRWGDVPPGR